MKALTSTVAGRILWMTLGLILLLGACFIAVTVVTTRLHMETIDQGLNAKLAASIISDDWITRNDAVGIKDVQQTIDKLMNVNPNAEIYVLDASGKILDYSAPVGRVKLTSVNLDPLQTFISGTEHYPIYGEDPREPGEPKVFSAAPLVSRGNTLGYVYVVLGGDAYKTVASMYSNSHVLRLGLGLSVGALIVTLLLAMITLRPLTRRLARLVNGMIEFEASNFETLPVPAYGNIGSSADEIDRAYSSFDRMAQRIKQQITAIRRQDHSRREMVTHILHDLKTPLATLQGYLETLIMKWREIDDTVREQYLKSAWQFSQQLGGIITGLFELAALDDPQTVVHEETFSMSELVQDVGQKYRNEAEQKDITLDVRILDEAAFVKGDIRLIERMLDNLIDNAVKFTADRGAIGLTLQRSADTVVVQVHDDGIGIPADELPNIFDRFYRAGQREGANVEGTGLGLAIARKIADLHDGDIAADSTPAAGTTFTVRLPAAPS